MNLPDFVSHLIKKPKKEVEYFLALLFTDEKIKAAVWQKEGSQGKIVGQAEKKTSDDWQEIIKDADEVITRASRDIPQDKIKKVIFGLSYSWTLDNKIRQPHLLNLKKLTSELSLTPIGFIVIDEAIINYLSQKEGAPATAILLGFRKTNFYLTLSQIGKIKGIREKPKEEGVQLCEEIAKTLKTDFNEVEVLPSKILLYDGYEDLELVKQELLSYPWLTKAKFLHFPKIDIIEENFDLKALVFSAAMEMGIRMEHEGKKEGEEKQEKQELKVIKKEEVRKESLEVVKEEERELEELKEEENFGFIKDKDIVEEMPPQMPDLTHIQEQKEKQEEQERRTIFPEEVISQERKIKLANFKFKFPKIPQFNLNFDFLANFKNYGILIGVISILFLLILILAYWRLPTAKVVLIVSPKTLEKEVEILVDPNSSISSIEKKRIPGIEIISEEKGSKKTKTTGKKIIGEKAKGEVTIFNKTNYAKTFSAGTILMTANNLKFTLNESVTIASQSSSTASDESITITPGKAKVNVTGVQIGAESNLAKGTDFTIEDFSTDNYKAKNETEAFSGGSSREVSVVSEDDQKKLLSLLTKELLDKAKEELSKKVTKEEKTIDQTIKEEVVNKKFSNEVKEEAGEISLDLTLKFKALAYETENLENIISEVVKKTTPKGYEYKKEEVEKEIKEVRIQNDKSVLLRMYFKAGLLPKIDLNEVKKTLAGKSLKVATDYLNKIPNVVGFEADISPKLPGLLYTFPRITNNIKIEVRRK